MPVRLRFVATFLLFALVTLIIYAIHRIHKLGIKKIGDERYFLHLCLSMFGTFIVLAYIFSNLASAGNTRYLTGIVYIGITYLAWLIFSLRTRFPNADVFASVVLISIILLSIPKIHAKYTQLADNASSERNRIQQIVHTAKQNDVQTILAPNGYATIRFYSEGTISPIVELISCNVPSSSTNNASWLIPSSSVHVAGLLIDNSASSKAEAMCSLSSIKSIYGTPTKVEQVPSLLNEHGTATLYIYHYDIRTKINHSGFNG